MPFREIQISAENQFSPPLALRAGDTASISIAGTLSATITLQRTFDQPLSGARWRDVTSWTAVVETSYTQVEDGYIRIGCKTGNFSSATGLIVRIRTDAHQPWNSFAVLLAACNGGSAFAANPYQRMLPRVAFGGAGAGDFNGVAGPP